MRISLEIISSDEQAAAFAERLISAQVAGGEVCLKLDNELHIHADVHHARRQP